MRGWWTAVVMSVLAASASGQSLWQARGSGELSLISDHVARRVGDIVTVVVQERQDLKDDGKVELTKEVGLDSGVEVFDLKPNAFNTLPALRYSHTREMDGETKYQQKGSFTTTISAVVLDVKPNGNLLIEGHRSIFLDGECKEMRVRGLVRPLDIGSDNSVLSSRIADGEVWYDTEGVRSESTSKGWFERFIDVIWPF